VTDRAWRVRCVVGLHSAEVSVMRNIGSIGVALLLLVAAPAAAQQEEPDQSQSDIQLQDAYEVMQGVTMGLMGATASLGLVQLYNMPTSFGDGACSRNAAILGDYACRGDFSLVHAAFGIATLGSYVATGVLALAAPDRDTGHEDTVTDVLGVTHAVGIGLTSTLGLLAANPGIIGITGDAATDFSRAMRVVHFMVALVTAGAFATHLVVDHVE
jgi:hypothetical protein